MLPSLPAIPPRETHTLWWHATYYIDEQSLNVATPDQTRTDPSNLSLLHYSRRPNSLNRNALQQLIADEEQIELRKSNIQHFGASWIRPAGVPKTYQAMLDEAVERAEQEAIARREAAMLEQTAAAEEDARRRPGGVGITPGEGAVDSDASLNPEHERDLDDDVPDAEELLFDEDSVQAEELYRDLDDDVPEPGSYQHTDTEAEDTSSVDQSGGDGLDDSTIDMLQVSTSP